MSEYGTFSDDFYNTVSLKTEMPLPSSRESVMHFFEQLQKCYPELSNFYGREPNEYVLEQDKEQGDYRWASVEKNRISSGYVNPPTMEDAIQQHQLIFDSAPHLLSASKLDCELLTVMFGFDFTYRGNHHQLLADVLGMPPVMERLAGIDQSKMLSYEPMLQIALDEDCRVQARISIDPRTNAYHVKTSEFPEEQLSVFLHLRRYGSIAADESFVSTIEMLMNKGREILEDHLIEHLLQPLQQHIAIK